MIVPFKPFGHFKSRSSTERQSKQEPNVKLADSMSETSYVILSKLPEAQSLRFLIYKGLSEDPSQY